MSTKKDKFSLKDQLYMELALDLAKAREGRTGTNPSVGCVIVKDNEIISIGQTSLKGISHAEYNAIKDSISNFPPHFIFYRKTYAAIKRDQVPWDVDCRHLSDDAKDLLDKFLQKDPVDRIDLDDALAHPWILTHCESA